MMLSAGYFRIRNALPGPVWTYPISYIAFHTYSIQARRVTAFYLLGKFTFFASEFPQIVDKKKVGHVNDKPPLSD